jgi:uncharacterized protein YjiS (DUF1127 family)
MHNKWRKTMQNLLNYISQKLSERNRYRRTVIELSNLTNRDLADIGVSRCDIPRIAAGYIRR